MKYVVIQNTYPVYLNVKRVNIGEIVTWKQGENNMLLLNNKGEVVYSSPDLTYKDEVTNDVLWKPFNKTGIISQVKSKKWILEIK